MGPPDRVAEQDVADEQRHGVQDPENRQTEQPP